MKENFIRVTLPANSWQEKVESLRMCTLCQGNICTLRTEGTTQDCLQETIRCYFNDNGIIWNVSASLLKKHRAQKIVGMVLCWTVASQWRVPPFLWHWWAYPTWWPRFWISDNLKQLNHQQVLNCAILQLLTRDLCCKIKMMKDVSPRINFCHLCIMTYAQFSLRYVTLAHH